MTYVSAFMGLQSAADAISAAGCTLYRHSPAGEAVLGALPMAAVGPFNRVFARNDQVFLPLEEGQNLSPQCAWDPPVSLNARATVGGYYVPAP